MMKGCSRITSISERDSRKYRAHPTMTMPMPTPFSPGPTIATTARTSTMKGKAMTVSATRPMTASNQPPMYPEIVPNVTPTMRPRYVMTATTSRSTRRP